MLKVCPICEKEAEIERYGDSKRSTIYRCLWCGCTLETGEEWGHGERWNDRLPSVQAAIAEYDRTIEAIGGCSDGCCTIRKGKGGQHTNGGCRCPSDQHATRRALLAAQKLRKALEII